MVSRLIHASINKDAAAIAEVQQLLGEISGAWRELRVNLAGQKFCQTYS